MITKNTGSEEPILHYIIHYQLVLSPTAKSPEFAHIGKNCAHFQVALSRSIRGTQFQVVSKGAKSD